MYPVCIYTLLKVVSYYDLSVLTTSVMGFQKKFGWGWVGGWGERYPSLFWIFFNFAEPLGLVIFINIDPLIRNFMH